MPFPVAAALAIGGGLSGLLSGGAASGQRRDAQAAAERAQGFLNPDAIRQQFEGLQGIFAPQFNQFANEQQLINQSQGNAVRSQFARAGLGNTGLGAGVLGGLQAGQAFQQQSLRARLNQDLLGQAIGTQQARAGIIGGQPASNFFGPTALTGGLQGLGGGLQAAGALGLNQQQQLGPVPVGQFQFGARPTPSNLGMGNPRAQPANSLGFSNPNAFAGQFGQLGS